MAKMHRPPNYGLWSQMKSRCNDPDATSYKYYGGRGIKVCERWHDFRNFFADMGPRPDDMTLDRKDNNGNYEPSNCKWSTFSEQNKNRRLISCGPRQQHWFIAMDGQGTMIASNNQNEFAQLHKLDNSCISKCLRGIRKQHKGWRFRQT